jgi:hypothetical protein
LEILIRVSIWDSSTHAPPTLQRKIDIPFTEKERNARTPGFRPLWTDISRFQQTIEGHEQISRAKAQRKPPSNRGAERSAIFCRLPRFTILVFTLLLKKLFVVGRVEITGSKEKTQPKAIISIIQRGKLVTQK